jgi:topoisomerase-4 subunit A
MVILEDAGLVVTKVAERKYIGDNILLAQLIDDEKKEEIINLVYEDQKSGRTYIKRFTVGGFTRDRRYELGSSKNCKVLSISLGLEKFAYVKLRKKPRIKTDLYVNFDDYLVKGRSANGVVLTKHKVSSVKEISKNVYCNRLDMDPGDLFGSSYEKISSPAESASDSGKEAPEKPSKPSKNPEPLFGDS